jgi:acetyl-CoA acetyltransferase
MSDARPVYVAGIGFHKFGRFPDKSLKQIAGEAALAALDDAGIRPGDLDVAFCANAYAGLLTGQESIRGETWLRPLGIAGTPIINVENACASGSSAAHLAILALRSGAYDTALVLGAEKMFVNDTSKTLRALASSADIEMMGGVGLQFAAVDAIRVKEVMDEEELTDDALEWVTVKSHGNGAHNPIAQFQKPVTAEQVRQSRMIAEPIRLFMCSAISDGAAALVLTTRKPARPVRVLASSMVSSPLRERDGDMSAVARAANKAYAEASLGPTEIDFAEVHDAVSPAELIYYRELGFCPPGGVAKFVHEKASAIGGRLPVNPSGGLNSRGHPVGATGVAQLAEATLQLREAAGKLQVDGARTGLVHNAGGWMVKDPAICTVHILQAA